MIYVTGDMHGDITRFDMPEMKSLKKGFRASDKMKWIMAPTILKEKLRTRSKQ